LTASLRRTRTLISRNTYIELIVNENDNTVKMTVLDDLKMKCGKASVFKEIIASQVIDILSALRFPDLQLRTKILCLAVALVTSKHIEEMVLVIKKEMDKISGNEDSDTYKYHQLLDRSLHWACAKFPDPNELKIARKRAVALANYQNISNFSKKMRMHKERIEENEAIIKELKMTNKGLKEEIAVIRDENKELKEKYEKVSKEKMCKICLNNNVDMVFFYCGHTGCSDCVKKISHCHVCRQEIIHRTSFYLS